MRKRKKKNHKKKYQQTERVKEINKKRIKVRDKMKTLEERKTEKNFIRNMYMEEIQNYKNEEIKKNIKIYEKLIRGIS